MPTLREIRLLDITTSQVVVEQAKRVGDLFTLTRSAAYDYVTMQRKLDQARQAWLSKSAELETAQRLLSTMVATTVLADTATTSEAVVEQTATPRSIRVRDEAPE